MVTLHWKTRALAESAPSTGTWRQLLVYLPAAGLTLAALLFAAPTRPVEPTPAEAAAPVQAGLRTIVLDPGHGGQATGAIAPGGLSEKEVTLDIALRLRELIFRRLGLQVVLTREADVDVPLDERTEKANYWQADLFVSIHANGYRLSEVRGPETYFLSDTASDAGARSLALSENEGAGDGRQSGPDGQPLDFILWDLAQTEHLRESSLLAETIQTDLNGLWQIRDRGVKQAPLRVLRGATMPAVLVEVGFLSNGEDASRLGDPGFRQRVAESLFDSINNFRQRYAVLVGAAPNP